MYRFLHAVINAFMHIVFWYKKGDMTLPTGPCLVCPNHKSNWDAPMVFVAFDRQFTFMAKDTLFKTFFVGWIIKKMGAFPVRRSNTAASAVMTTLRVLKSGGSTVVFPEGRRMLDGSRGKANPALIKIAIQSQVPIVPCGISGRYVPFTRPSIRTGEPIYYDKYYDERPDDETMEKLCEELMDKIYELVK